MTLVMFARASVPWCCSLRVSLGLAPALLSLACWLTTVCTRLLPLASAVVVVGWTSSVAERVLQPALVVVVATGVIPSRLSVVVVVVITEGAGVATVSWDRLHPGIPDGPASCS